MQNGNSGDTSRIVAFATDYDPVALLAFSTIGFLPFVRVLFGDTLSQTTVVTSVGYILLLWCWAAVSFYYRQ